MQQIAHCIMSNLRSHSLGNNSADARIDFSRGDSQVNQSGEMWN